MATFSDLMNLLLCFFVLLFSMSNVDAEKLQEVVASMQNTISILPGGSSAIGDGQMISAGVRQLEFLDNYYNEVANSSAEDSEEQTEGKQSLKEAYEEQALEESEEMAEAIQAAIERSGLGDEVELDFSAEYVQLNLSGAILFESGKADLITDAIPIIDKIGKILETYDQNIIEVEGHTDNVPIHSAKFENNEVLSMYRALAVTERLRETTDINAKYLKFAGRGDYVPVADNSTAEGRARNRRVEIKVYNSYNSDLGE
jgi:chemotaxis protein MotB